MAFNVVGLRNRVLNGHSSNCHLANTVKQLCTVAVCGSATKYGDAACSLITLGNLVRKS